ncbi:hypothetical protein Bca101_018269 [Brassica carinata]
MGVEIAQQMVKDEEIITLSPPPLYHYISSLVSCPNPNSPLDSILHLLPQILPLGFTLIIIIIIFSILPIRRVSIFAERSRYYSPRLIVSCDDRICLSSSLFISVFILFVRPAFVDFDSIV